MVYYNGRDFALLNSHVSYFLSSLSLSSSAVSLFRLPIFHCLFHPWAYLQLWRGDLVVKLNY